MTSEVEARKRPRREARARLVEATPRMNAWGHWVLSAPAIFFFGWLWLDLIRLVSPVSSPPVDFLLGALSYLFLILLPLGYGAHRFVTSFPRVFQQAGWTVHPLEPLKPAERHSVRYIFASKERATTNGRRILLRVAQGWVYLEVGAILVGFVALAPLFISAIEFGFGR